MSKANYTNMDLYIKIDATGTGNNRLGVTRSP